MKMYKIDFIMELLKFEKEEYESEYVGFEINESGNLVFVYKEHQPDYPEAVSQVELLGCEGEY